MVCTPWALSAQGGNSPVDLWLGETRKPRIARGIRDTQAAAHRPGTGRQRSAYFAQALPDGRGCIRVMDQFLAVPADKEKAVIRAGPIEYDNGEYFADVDQVNSRNESDQRQP